MDNQNVTLETIFTKKALSDWNRITEKIRQSEEEMEREFRKAKIMKVFFASFLIGYVVMWIILL